MNITTSLSTIRDGHTFVRGQNLEELATTKPFHEVIYLLLRGELPSSPVSKLFSAMLSASIDHGAHVPSIITARTSFSGSGQVNSAVAAGIGTLGDHHGGAIHLAAFLFEEYLAASPDAKEASECVLRDVLRKGKRVPGYGHKILKEKDPRVTFLYDLAESLSLTGKYVAFSLALEEAIAAEKQKRIPLNIDGGLAALLLDLGFPAAAAHGFFLIARVPGIVAHVTEEALREKPFRRLADDEVIYDGR